MPDDAADARVLLRLAPDEYIAERARLVKQARAAGDRERATFYQSLKRPTLSLWAVLAAGDDADAVHAVVSATTEVAKVQAGGGAPTALSAATQARRKALEALVDRAVTALARSDSGAQTRRPEIRGMVDRLSRRPDLAEAWIDGTLRDLPDDAVGFAVFADLPVTAPSRAGTPRRATRAKAKPAERAPPPRREVAAAARELAAAERRVEAASDALRKAEEEMRLADRHHAAAQQRHAKATKGVEASEDQ